MDYSVDRWHLMSEIIEYIGVSRGMVLNWIADKKLPAHKSGWLWKFKVSEVDEWVRSDEAFRK